MDWSLNLKIFTVVTAGLVIKHLETTAYHPQTHSLVEGFSQTTEEPLQNYVANYQTDWDQFLQLLVYTYNAKYIDQQALHHLIWDFIISQWAQPRQIRSVLHQMTRQNCQNRRFSAAGSTKSAGTANAPLTKLMSETVFSLMIYLQRQIWSQTMRTASKKHAW